ncbi:ABC transporter substrate-binding protein [Rhodospirillum rubrum]|uniref:Extracellular solute-binding protein, family 5 n=1 Tax=Rhodospirillum rubrum (strain ATCC 11170 / ATH 1.1.1 / DSM 467 / LMG 4362 / NCIMB 8255 / S1) TaxID=269796 RepID=Q2RVR5_RHORT|nr:ABC transporter substrate-binding protein [Rhodospirillum rubrum]ABC21780.1 extracellular solute-binding protein, family 5 [Rhodospirillum rubrum ATCC 11170]MBK5953338.1 peptide ABC transporter substrate-binding protein [Rhodospirillum rubrum]QXG81444.1 ABC transporter substrate-binding protein [Rhodospirillum rubrum]
MSLKRMSRWAAAVLVASAAAFTAAPATRAAEGPKVLRIVPQADLKILDPIWTTAFVTRNHGYMIYDTLFGVDAEGVIHPQMVDRYEASADAKSFRFTLREGLAFHDGQPVTATDVIASLKRWGARDNLGQKMLASLESIEAVDAKTVAMTFKTPFGMVLDALSKPSSVPAFIMPARVAATPPDQQITDTTGSGPYMFVKDEFRPGERVVYAKNPAYVPRAEPPSGTAGGKVVYVDRAEWIILKDAQTQANALVNGEVDLIEWLPAEQYAGLKSKPDIKMEAQVVKMSVMLHLNHLIAPFNNPKIAQAALMAINQQALMRAQLVHKELYNGCTSIYPCGTTYASENTAFFTGKPQFDKAKALLKEAGYDGTPVVLMYPADFAVINKYPPVMAELLKQAGFVVDMQSMDWPTLVTRRTKKDPVAAGGWNAFITSWGMADTMNPMFFAPLTGSGEKGWFGWTTDDQLEALKSEFLVTTDGATRKKLAEGIQLRAIEAAVFGPIGEFKPLTAYRTSVSGLVTAPVPVFWNLKKD